MMELDRFPEDYAVCQKGAHDADCQWINRDAFWSLTVTDDEASIVCLDQGIPENVKKEPGWTLFRISGPLDFSLVGILSSVLEPLAKNDISVFTISTYNTDYILIKSNQADQAQAILEECGHTIKGGDGMIQRIQLEPGIYEIQTQFKGNRFRAFLVETIEGNILIDTCMEDDTSAFLNTIIPLHIHMIVLTHHHRDHTGALAGIAAALPGVKIAAHRLEIQRLPVPVTNPLEDGDLISGVLRVIHVPGHTAGNIALYHEKKKVLFTGDSIFGAGGPRKELSSPPKVYSDDVQMARDNIQLLLAYPFEKAYLSHGKHLEADAQAQVRALLEKAPAEEK